MFVISFSHGKLPPTGLAAPTGAAVPTLVPAGIVVPVHGLSFMGPVQSAKVAPLTFFGLTVQGNDHILLIPASAVVVKMRKVAVTTFQSGACGYDLALENRLQTLPLGASQLPFIRDRLPILMPFNTGHTDLPSGKVMPFTTTVLPVGSVLDAAQRAYCP